MIIIVITEQTDNPQEVLQGAQKADLIIHVNSRDDRGLAQSGYVRAKEGFTLRPDQAQTIADAILMAAEEDSE